MVTVTLNFCESDGDNYADAEARYAGMASAALLVATAAVPAIGVVTIPVTFAIDTVTSVIETLHGILGNRSSRCPWT